MFIQARTVFYSWLHEAVPVGQICPGLIKVVATLAIRRQYRRKLTHLRVVNERQLAEQALHSIGGLYEVVRQIKEMSDEDRRRLRQKMAVAIAASSARACDRRIGYGQGFGLKLETLGCADALPG